MINISLIYKTKLNKTLRKMNNHFNHIFYDSIIYIRNALRILVVWHTSISHAVNAFYDFLEAILML